MVFQNNCSGGQRLGRKLLAELMWAWEVRCELSVIFGGKDGRVNSLGVKVSSVKEFRAALGPLVGVPAYSSPLR